MATPTYTPIATQTLGSSQATVTFSSISGSYTDLVLVVSAKASAVAGCFIQLNGDTGSNYSDTYMYGDGSSAASGRVTSTPYGYIGNSYTDSFINVVNIMNYANTNTYKTFLSRGNYNGQVSAWVNLWRGSTGSSTEAVTSIDIKLTGGNTFNSGSTFTLYGISNAGDVTPKATGGDVYSDSSYWYHVFTMSGNFVPNQSLTADYLVIAGGGGGAQANYSGGGGGGAGGLRSTVGTTGGGGSLESAVSLSANTSYTVAIGAGGATANSGSNSFISGSGLTTITSVGGGRGGAPNYAPLYYLPETGGSGGGAGGQEPSNKQYGAAGTANQGYAGGESYVSSSSSNNQQGGGGGGAGGVGVNADATNAGAGGPGVQITAIATATSTGVSGYYAGGGGAGKRSSTGVGGTGGVGGGGAGRANSTLAAYSGIVSTGGGGGGAGLDSDTSVPKGGNGGSGLVVIRYAK